MEYVEPVRCIANCLGTPVCKYLRYHRKLNDYVRNLKSIKDELNGRMADIELQLKAELLHPVGKIPKKGVENWLEKANAVNSEARDVETKVSNGRYLCRACNGKLADEKTQEMQKLLDKAPNVSEGLVIDGPSVGLPLPTSELVGEKAARDEIWRSLMQDGVSKIGVWGMGGVGKTTIMKHIHNDLLKEKTFERVFWVTVSKEFNVMKLQEDIASELNTPLPKEGDQLKRATILLDILKKAGKHVLILDDVWDKVSLDEVGIPEPSSSNGCKLVLTTRSEQVCNYMGCKVIKVKPLSKEEALILFLNKVGPNMVQSPTLMPTLRLVVKECAGLPLTIIVVAGTLKGEDDHRIWKNALRELKDRIGRVEGAEAAVIERLKFSYYHLKDEKVKQCFLYCALYPEDFAIAKDELIECWIDEGFIGEMDTRQEMKDKGYAILKKLKDNCLFENATAGYNFNRKPGVKMHDAVRDMALSITCLNRRYMIRAGLQLEMLPEEKNWTSNIEKISLMHNSISNIPTNIPLPNCQQLTTFLLQENPFIKKIPDSFFENMPCLGILNLSDTSIECLPDSISELKNLTALLLGGCTELRHVPCLVELQLLKKLDLHDTKIVEVPEGMDMLMKLMYLDLRVETLEGIPVGAFSKLSRLQHLDVHHRYGKTRLKAEEVLSLEKLEFFSGCFEDVNELNKFVSSMQQSMKNLIAYRLLSSMKQYKENLMTYYWIGLSAFNDYSVRDKRVEIIGFELDRRELMLPNDIQEFRISDCHNKLRNLSNDISSLKNAIDLRSCEIDECDEMECVVSFSSSCSTHPFQSLEVLGLFDLPKLSDLIKVEGFGSATTSILAPSATFSNLKEIRIINCNLMRMLFPHWVLPNLQNLEIIHVVCCDELEEIFGAAPTPVEATDALIKFKLPKLRDLILDQLPELRSICNNRGAMVCDSLKLMVIVSCDKLKKIPPFVPLDGNGEPYEYAPPSLQILSRIEEGWGSLEWDDHPNFKNLLQPLWKVYR